MRLSVINDTCTSFNDNFKLVMSEALEDSNPNAQNLSHLLTRKYLLKNVVMDDYGPVAIGAIEDFSNNKVRCARLLTRTYYMRRARNPVWWKKISSGPIVRALLPHQIDWTLANGFTTMFVSMETIKKRQVLKSWVNAINEWSKHKWHLEDDMFFTCKCQINNDARCWQNVASLKFFQDQIPLHHVTMEKFSNMTLA